MNKQDFYFDLPPDLIAQYPLPNRSDSRLLTYDRKRNQHQHVQFSDLPQLLNSGDLLVLNNSKVIPARFYGKKTTGGQVEFLLERLLNQHSFLAHIKASKAPRAGSVIELAEGWQLQIIAKLDDLYHCQVEGEVDTMLEEIGQIPLPSYINRPSEGLDSERYQTVYARHKGSVAAPTAGLHFDKAMFERLQEKGINTAYSTLHVGAGTFRPVRSDAIADHKMHKEQCEVSASLCEAVNKTHEQGGRVIAVGTTAMRSLESAAQGNLLQPYQGDTDIFITPGYQFKICDGLLTNFHLPESTLVMLVSAFVGHSKTMSLYEEAITQGYRFFSYGDASLFL